MCVTNCQSFVPFRFLEGDGGQRIGGGGLDEIPGKTALLGEADARNEGDKIRTNKVVDPNTEDIDSRALNDDAS